MPVKAFAIQVCFYDNSNFFFFLFLHQTHGLLFDSEPLEADAAQNWDWIIAKMLEMLSPEGGEDDLPPLYTLEVISRFPFATLNYH